jgi:hypothetical protein
VIPTAKASTASEQGTHSEKPYRRVNVSQDPHDVPLFHVLLYCCGLASNLHRQRGGRNDDCSAAVFLS